MSVVSTMNAKRATDEVRHANDELEHFYLEARRNRKIANWAADKLDRDKKSYFLDLVGADLTKAGPKPVIDQILADFKDAGLEIAEEDVWAELREIERSIINDMMREQARRTEEEMRAQDEDAPDDGS